MFFKNKPLTVLLGAGASFDLGIPITNIPKDRIIRAIQRILGKPSSRNYHRTNPADIDLLVTHLNSEYGADNWNFEHLLNTFEVVDNLASAWQSRTFHRYRIAEGVLTDPRQNLIPLFQNQMFAYLGKEVLYKTLNRIYSRASRRIIQSRNWSGINCFLNQLNQKFDLRIATLNYDLVVEKALNWGAEAEGFKRVGDENYSEFSNSKEIPKLMHLHGSVNFGFKNSWVGNVNVVSNELCRFDSPQAAGKKLMSNISVLSSTGHRIDVGPIITGFRKLDRFACEPYFSYFRNFSNLLARTPNLLVIGYGFGDEHINNVLLRMPVWHGLKRRIIFIDFLNRGDCDSFGVWPQSYKIQEFSTVMRIWSGEDNPFVGSQFPEPWIPSGEAKNCLRVFMGGFIETVEGHSEEIVKFFR